MKKIILAILLLLSINAYSQIDSFKIKVSVSLQVRDWLFINSLIANNEEFENIYDSMKVKLRSAVAPTMTTVVRADSVKQGQVIRLSELLRSKEYRETAIPFARINTALRLNAYLIRKIDELDTNAISDYNTRLQSEIDKLRSVLQ